MNDRYGGLQTPIGRNDSLEVNKASKKSRNYGRIDIGMTNLGGTAEF